MRQTVPGYNNTLAKKFLCTFVTVDHAFLLRRLKTSYGFRGCVLTWFMHLVCRWSYIFYPLWFVHVNSDITPVLPPLFVRRCLRAWMRLHLACAAIDFSSTLRRPRYSGVLLIGGNTKFHMSLLALVMTLFSLPAQYATWASTSTPKPP